MTDQSPEAPPPPPPAPVPYRPNRPYRPSLLANFVSPVSLACFFLVAVVGLALDLWTKYLAWTHFVADAMWHEGRVILIRTGARDMEAIPGLLEFTAVANQGAAMGLGQGRVTLFLTVSVLAVGVLLYFFALSGRRRIYQIVLGLLLAGVLGNFYDRLVHGYVRDMIHIFPGYRWDMLHGSLPAVGIFPWVFNIADMFLCVGVVAVLIYGVLLAPEEEPADEPQADSPKAPAT